MEIAKQEVEAVDAVVQQAEITELSELQLVLTGGGNGVVVLA